MAEQMHGNGSRPISDSRTFLLFAASLALFNQALAAVACSFIPKQPDLLARFASGYAAVAFAISALGLVGILKGRPKYLALFSHFLWLDAVLSSMARALVVELLFSTFDTHGFCVDSVQKLWMAPSSSAAARVQRRDPFEVTDMWCGVAISTFHVFCALLVLSLSVAQGTVALTVRRYGCDLGRASDQGLNRIGTPAKSWPEEKRVQVDTAVP